MDIVFRANYEGDNTKITFIILEILLTFSISNEFEPEYQIYTEDITN